MSCCSVAFCGFVVHGSVCRILGCCRLFGSGFISFFLRKNVAVASGFAFRGHGVATATPSGLESFKAACFSKKGGAGLCSRFGYLRFLNSFPPSLYSPVTYSNPASMS
jgi:hypothetical protein